LSSAHALDGRDLPVRVDGVGRPAAHRTDLTKISNDPWIDRR